jgi:hypothetical protein
MDFLPFRESRFILKLRQARIDVKPGAQFVPRAAPPRQAVRDALIDDQKLGSVSSTAAAYTLSAAQDVDESALCLQVGKLGGSKRRVR